MTPEALTIESLVDKITAITDSMTDACNLLLAFEPQEQENCLTGSALCALCVHLECARDLTGQCLAFYMRMQQTGQPSLLPQQSTPAKSGELYNENPLIQVSLQGTLSEIDSTLQFLITLLERTDIEGQERIFNATGMKGFLNLLTTINAAAEHCFEQCFVA